MLDTSDDLDTVVVEPSPLDNARTRYLFYAMVAFVLALTQVIVVSLMAVEGTTPDLLFIFAVWVTLAEGRIPGLLAAFAVGLLHDVLSLDILGSNALAKVVAIFVVSYAYKENKQMKLLGTYRFPLYVTLGGLLHNLIYFFFYLDPVELPFASFFLRYGVAATLYTTVFAIVPMLFVGRKRGWS